MKNLLILFALITLTLISRAQIANYSWHQQFDGLNNNECQNIIITPDSGIVAFGYFNYPIDFNPDPMSYILSASRGNLFLTKYTADGHFLWAVNFDSTGYLNVRSIETDRSGDIYIFGTFNGYADMDPSSDTLIFSGGSGASFFFAKYGGNDGHLIMAKRFGNNIFSSQVKDMAIDHNKNIFLSGDFSDTIDFDPGPANFYLYPTPSAVNDSYISKYDSLGNFIHAVQLTGDVSVGGITCDVSGNFYMAGFFRGPMDFDPGATIHNQNGNGVFLAKYDNNLNYSKAVGFIGTANIDLGRMELICNSNNELFLTAPGFDGQLDFDASANNAYCQTSYPWFASVFTRQDTALNFLSAFSLATVNYSSTIRTGFSIYRTATDKYNNMYAIGEVLGLYDADPGAGVVTYNTVSNNTLLVKYDVNGNYISSYIIEGSGDQTATDVAVGRNNEMYASLNFKGRIDVKNGPDSLFLPVVGPDFNAAIIGIIQCASTIDTINTTICSGQSFIIGAESFKTPGTFVRRLTSSTNCDSIIVLNLQVKNIDLNLCLTGEDLFSDVDSATFRWINCNNNQIINGATSSSFHVPDNDGYAVEITKSGCVDTTECMQIFERANETRPVFSWGMHLPNYDFASDVNMLRLDSKENLILGIEVSDTSDMDLTGNKNWYLNALLGHVCMALAKYDQSRNLLWSFCVGDVQGSSGSSDDVVMIDMNLDDDDNIYVVGYNNCTFDIDPGPSQFIILDSGFGPPTYFLAKYNSSGQFVWAKPLNNILPYCVFTNHTGSVYVGGNVGGFVNPELTLEEFDGVSNNLTWSFSPTGSSGSTDNAIMSGACDKQNNIKISGVFNGTIDFNPDTTLTNTLYSSNNLQFEAIYNSSHQFDTASIVSNSHVAVNDGCRVIANCNDQFYITNNPYQGSAIYNGIGQYFCFLSNAKIGNITFDKYNNVYAVFSFADSCIVGTDTFYSGNNRKIGIAKFDETGQFDWAAVLYDSANSLSKDIVVDDNGSIYISGIYGYSIDLDVSQAVYQLNSLDPYQNFISVYNQICAPVDTSVDGDSLRISAHNQRSYYQWINCSTNQPLPGGNSFVIPDYASGFYKVIVYQGDCVDTSDCHFASPTTNIDQLEKFQFSIYPNPTSLHELSIITNTNIKTVDIYKLDGTIILHEEFNEKQNNIKLKLDNYSKGVYIVKVTDDTGACVWRKLILASE